MRHRYVFPVRPHPELVEGLPRAQIIYMWQKKEEDEMISPKKQMTKIIREQPEDSSYEEILRELAFARMVERGLADSKGNRTVADAQMKRRIQTWQK